jgi:hypothetical protein
MRKGHVWLTKLRVETQPLIEPVEIKVSTANPRNR